MESKGQLPSPVSSKYRPRTEFSVPQVRDKVSHFSDSRAHSNLYHYRTYITALLYCLISLIIAFFLRQMWVGFLEERNSLPQVGMPISKSVRNENFLEVLNKVLWDLSPSCWPRVSREISGSPFMQASTIQGPHYSPIVHLRDPETKNPCLAWSFSNYRAPVCGNLAQLFGIFSYSLKCYVSSFPNSFLPLSTPISES